MSNAALAVLALTGLGSPASVPISQASQGALDIPPIGITEERKPQMVGSLRVMAPVKLRTLMEPVGLRITPDEAFKSLLTRLGQRELSLLTSERGLGVEDVSDEAAKNLLWFLLGAEAGTSVLPSSSPTQAGLPPAHEIIPAKLLRLRLSRLTRIALPGSGFGGGQGYVTGPPPNRRQAFHPAETGSLPPSSRPLPQNRYDFRGLESVLGKSVAVPRAGRLADFLKQVGAEAGISLFVSGAAADREVSPPTQSTAPLGDLLRAVALSVDGCWRRLGADTVLAPTQEGGGVLDARKAKAASEAESGRGRFDEQAAEVFSTLAPYRGNDELSPTDSQRRRSLPPTLSFMGKGHSVAFRDLTPAQRSAALEGAAQSGLNLGERAEVVLLDALWIEVVAPSLGKSGGFGTLSDRVSFSLSSRHSRPDFPMPPSPSPSLLNTVEKRSILATLAQARLLAQSLPDRALDEVWVQFDLKSLFEEMGGQKVEAEALARSLSMKGIGLRVAVSLLGSRLEGLAVDRTVHGTPAGNCPLGALQSGAAQRMGRALSRLPGGLSPVLLDSCPPGWRGVIPLSSNVEELQGYSVEFRQWAIRNAGVDPVDVMPYFSLIAAEHPRWPEESEEETAALSAGMLDTKSNQILAFWNEVLLAYDRPEKVLMGNVLSNPYDHWVCPAKSLLQLLPGAPTPSRQFQPTVDYAKSFGSPVWDIIHLSREDQRLPLRQTLDRLDFFRTGFAALDVRGVGEDRSFFEFWLRRP